MGTPLTKLTMAKSIQFYFWNSVTKGSKRNDVNPPLQDVLTSRIKKYCKIRNTIKKQYFISKKWRADKLTNSKFSITIWFWLETYFIKIHLEKKLFFWLLNFCNTVKVNRLWEIVKLQKMAQKIEWSSFHTKRSPLQVLKGHF